MGPSESQATSLVEPLAGLPATPDDRYFDLAFVGYRPLRPIEGKYRAETLLWDSLRVAGQHDAWAPALRAIQAGVGRGRTIWGVVDRAGQRAWELRIANPSGAPGLITELRDTLAPWLRLVPDLDDPGGYQVLELSFDAATLAHGSIDELALHSRGEPRELVVTRLAHASQGELYRYVVLETKREIDEVLPRVKASSIIDYAADKRLLGRALIPELFACRRLHIAHERKLDSLVFSSINVEQLYWFVRKFGFPEPTIALLATQQEQFDHLLFDVRVRYRYDAENRSIAYASASYHGTL